MKRSFMALLSVVLCSVFAACLCSCAPYYETRVKMHATMEQTVEAIQQTAFNLPDLSLIEDKGTVVNSGLPEERYIGTRSFPSVVRGVRSLPTLGVRVSTVGDSTTIRLNSSGDERESDLFAVALEQELADEHVLPKDSLPLPIYAMSPKSSWIQQGLNLIDPGLGLWYIMNDNPYSLAEWWRPAAIGAADIAGLALAIPSAIKVASGNPSRANQYQFVIGAVVCAGLRYVYGMDGIAKIIEYNELTQTPYYLGASYVRSRITEIGVSVRFP